MREGRGAYGALPGSRLEVHRTADLVSEAVAWFQAISPRTVVLAGGSTPRPFYEALASISYPWAEVQVFFGDERCVPLSHPDSNEGMARRALLDHVPAAVHSMAACGCDPACYEADLRAHFGPGEISFDLAILGLGADGHTASLFPGDPALEEALALVARVERPDHPRLTLTLPVLSGAARVMFLVSGAAKAPALRRLVARDPAIPASRVRARRIIVLTDLTLDDNRGAQAPGHRGEP